MYFVVIGWDAPDSREKRPVVRPAHLEYWKSHDAAGIVYVAGQLTDFAGSMFVLEADTVEQIQALMAADPYVTQGVFARHEVHPFKPVLPSKTWGGK